MTTVPQPSPVASVDEPRHPLMPTYAPAPVTFVRGQGSELWDSEGRRYLDFLSGIAVTSLGHAHPEVADAVATQARTLVHVSNLFSTPGGPAVARTLDRLLGDGAPAGGQVFFANSGAEANECAIKLARRWAPGRPVIVCADGGFHGRTMGALAATGQPAKQAPFQPLPEGFVHVPYGDLDAVDRVLADLPVGAVLVEAIQGEAGVVLPPAGYLVALAERCRRAGVLLMLDEVQTGLGRTGRWFAHHHDGIRPDVVTMAKALGNGFPVGACWARAEVAAAFVPGDHATTFGGQPLAAAAAAVTLSVMRREDVPRRARAAGARLSGALEPLPTVSAVRGAGLLLGVVLPTPTAAEAVAAALAAGLVVNAPRPDVIRLAPSLLVSDAEIDEAAAVLAAVLEQVVR
jgi:predicted acetylornithine/succinylornithine family transaminase